MNKLPELTLNKRNIIVYKRGSLDGTVHMTKYMYVKTVSRNTKNIARKVAIVLTQISHSYLLGHALNTKLGS